jgi:transposase
MARLTERSAEDLRRALAGVDEATPAVRIVAGIAYKHGVTQTELARWFDVERKTIYNWLTRLESGDIERAVTDRERGGRPHKLDEQELATIERTLQEPPTAAGYDAAAWSPPLVRKWVCDRFDAEYSIPSCRRLLKRAGLTYVRPPWAHTEIVDESVHENPSRAGLWVPVRKQDE